MDAFIVMGVSGSGKSTFGRHLAARWSAPFLEGDEFHSPDSVEKMRHGIALDDQDRWPWLDRIAKAFVVYGAHNTRVVGTCSALKRNYRDLLRTRIPARTVFLSLEATGDILASRMTSRPGHFMPRSLLSSQLSTYERPEAGELALCLDSTKPVDELLAEVDTWWTGQVTAKD